MKKIFTTATLSLLALGVAVFIAKPNGAFNVASAKQNPALEVAGAIAYDFGKISMSEGVVNHQFKISNISAESVTIKKAYTSCMCTNVSVAFKDGTFGPYGMPGHGAIPRISKTVNSGEEFIIDVAFDPAAHGPAGVGRIQRTVTVENSAGEPVEILIAATVTP